jgi:carboxypeptidase Q
MNFLPGCALFALFFSVPLAASAEEVDLEVVHLIKQEAFVHSQVMDYMHELADVNGPRMSGSPGFRRAAESAVDAFQAAGIKIAEIESWGDYGRGWDWSRVAVNMKAPHETTLSAYPADFSGATSGPVSGEVVFAPIWEKEDRQPVNGDLVKLAERIEEWKNQYRGQLKGKIVMLSQPAPFNLPAKPPEYRFGDERLSNLVAGGDNPLPGPVPKDLQWPVVSYPIDKEERSRIWDIMPLEFAADRWRLEARIGARIHAFLKEEAALGVLVLGWGHTAAVIMHSDFGSPYSEDPTPPPSLTMMPEHYNRIHRLVEREVPVVLEIDIDARYYPNQPGLNVIAEIPGGKNDDEIVMLGAHLDSWHGATGASDNAAGSAVVMEVMRILKKLDRPMNRTVRAALWGEEEQCLCGSRGYVRKHYADPVTMKLKPAHEKLSTYFNLDNGGGKIRGIYLQQNDMARPIFESWMAPFSDLGVSTTTIMNTNGTDHLSYNAVGLPGFNFVQDPLDYSVNTHHSNVDHIDHVPEGDLMQAAAVMASVVYHAAMSEKMMPRKPLPIPLPEKQPLPQILQ